MVLFEVKKRYINYLSFGYVEQHNSKKVNKSKKFKIKTCDFRGLATDIKRELLNKDIEKLDAENLPFMRQM